MIKEGGETSSTEFILVQNWFEELKRLVPVIFQNHDPTFFINMPPGSKAYPIINTTTSSDL